MGVGRSPGQTAAVEIRPYAPADLAAIHAINEAEVPAVGTVTPDALRAIADESVIALVAADGDAIGGFCLVLGPGSTYGSSNYRWFSERYDDFIYLDRVAIAPAFRRRGVGTELYRAVEHWAATNRPTATDFTLEVNLRPRNDGSLAFHDRLGFVEVAQRETDYGALVSMMTKPLGAAA